MKAGLKKTIEIGLLVCNLIAFIIINLVTLRRFHPVPTVFMAVPLVITVVFVARNRYVDWQKKSPSILPLLISLGIYVVCSIILNIPILNDCILVISSILKFISLVLSILFFIRFMISYNVAFSEHKKELQLGPKMRLYNASIPVLFAFIIILVWAVAICFLDKIATVNSPKKYEAVITDSNYEFFPDSLPDDARNEEFYQFPGFWLSRSKSYVKFETSEEYVEEYELLYDSEAKKVNSIDEWIQRHIETSMICKCINDNYLNEDNCDIYVKTEGHSIQGYAINRNTNELFIFYDGFD